MIFEPSVAGSKSASCGKCKTLGVEVLPGERRTEAVPSGHVPTPSGCHHNVVRAGVSGRPDRLRNRKAAHRGARVGGSARDIVQDGHGQCWCWMVRGRFEETAGKIPCRQNDVFDIGFGGIAGVRPSRDVDILGGSCLGAP